MLKSYLCGAFLALSLAGCEAATRYDSGAIVLDISDPHAFSLSEGAPEAFGESLNALEQNRIGSAEALLNQSLEQEPKDPNSLLAMGGVMETIGRYGSASDYYRSASYYGEDIRNQMASGEDQATVSEAALGKLTALER